jgi:urate oxidase
MAEQDNTFLNADYIYEEVEGESGKNLTLPDDQRRNLIGIIKGRYAQAEDARETDERRWLRAYENYRGLYNKSVKFRDSEKSRIFVKITKTKVLAAFGQLVDVIFGTGKFPIGIAETKIPEGETDYAHLDTSNPVPGIETYRR